MRQINYDASEKARKQKAKSWVTEQHEWFVAHKYQWLTMEDAEYYHKILYDF